MTYLVDHKNHISPENRVKIDAKKPSLTRGGLIGLALLPLSACGGGGSSSPTSTVTPPPPPTPDFTESPTSTFTARDDNDRMLDQGSSSSDLMVIGKAGNDTITTGSGADVILGGAGNDTITSGAGADMIRGGEGADNINAGDGDDVIVVVGTTTADQYDAASITNPGSSGVDLSSLITLADLNGRSVSEVVSGEVIDGGAGNNTLYIYGTVDLTGVTLTNVTQLIVNSDVTLTAAQIAQFTTIDGDGNSVINIVVPEGSGEVILDLSMIDVSDIGSLNITGDLTIRMSSFDDVAGISQVTVDELGALKLTLSNSNGPVTFSLDSLASTFGKVAVIDLNYQVTLEISNAIDVSDLGLAQITGRGDIDVLGGDDVGNVLRVIDIDQGVDRDPNISASHFFLSKEGETVLDEAVFRIDDSDDPDSSVFIQVSNILYGHFTRDGEAVTEFTLADVKSGIISFVSEGGGNLPSFSFAVKDDDPWASYGEPVAAEVSFQLFESLELSKSNILSGTENVTFNFDFGDREATLNVRLKTSEGKYILESFKGASGTLTLPQAETLEGEEAVTSYTIESISVTESDGRVTVLSAAQLISLGINDTTVNVWENPADGWYYPFFDITAFSAPTNVVEFGADEAAHFSFAIAASIPLGAIRGIMVKYLDPNGGLHSEYINGPKGSVSITLDKSVSPAGEYNLFEVTVYGHAGNQQTISSSSLQSEFGSSVTKFTVINPEVPALDTGSHAIDSYLALDGVASTGNELYDGILSGYQYAVPENGDPLLITYSFVNPAVSVFPDTGYYAQDDVTFDNNEFLQMFSGAEQGVVRSIFDNLENFINVKFIEVRDQGEGSAGQIRFSWTTDPAEAADDTAAFAFLPYPSSVAGDVWMVAQDDGYFSGDGTHNTFRETLLHEIGHALGLSHPFEDEDEFGILPTAYDGGEFTVMSYTLFAGNNDNVDYVSRPQSYMSLDIGALQHLYGVSTAYDTEDTLYALDPTKENYFTLTDTGGIDTLDSHLFDANVSISLTPGDWSDLEGGGNFNAAVRNYTQFTISADTVIENLITGAGDDILKGNHEDNILMSGAGNDIFMASISSAQDHLHDSFDGGAGYDVLKFLNEGSFEEVIDLSLVAANALEVIDIDNGALSSEKIILTLEDVLGVTGVENKLIIRGDIHDTVTSTLQDWLQGDDQVIDEETYHTYTSGDATLLIDTDITQDIS